MILWCERTAADLPRLSDGAGFLAGADRRLAGFLAEEELRRLAGLKLPKRRQDWLLGRWAAKRLLQDYHAFTAGVDIPADDLAIRPDRRGAPQVWRLGAGEPLPIGLSISHSEGHAACALCDDREAAIGIDIETVAPRSPAFAADFLTEAERDRVAGQDPDALITAIWSGKEAALKALGIGLAVDTRQVTCIPGTGTPQDGWWPLDVRCAEPVLTAAALTRQPIFRGWWRLSGERAITLVAAARK